MFVGDKGKILAGFLGSEPHLIPEEKMRAYQASKNAAETKPKPGEPRRNRRGALEAWVAACRGGEATFGDFRLAGPISDAFNLGAVSLRLGGRRLRFDAASAGITNLPEANKYLTREYRKGWELAG